MGALDVYSSKRTEGSWTVPVALPAPINSTRNDVGFTLMSDGFSGIMSSDRNGTDRIFVMKYTREKFQECTEQIPDNFCFAFKGRKHAATNSLPLEHVWDMGDGTRLQGHRVDHCYEKPGTYEVRSLLIDKKTGAIFHVISVNDLEVQQRVQAFIAAPDTVRTGRQVAFDPSMSQLGGMTTTAYHWDMGDGTQRTSNRVIHQYKQPGVYEVRLDVHSTPDASGHITSRCNTKKIVVMDRYREHEDQTVVAVYQDAFGQQHRFEFQELPMDDHALAFADNADVTFSVTLIATRERMSLDDPRFVEVKKLYRVVERYDPVKGLYTYSVGETSDLAELYAVFQKVKELQFLDAEVFALEVEKLVDLSQLDLASLEDLNNTKLRTSAIHFDFNSALIQDGSETILEQIVGLLRQHPKLHLVIEAHTDDIGSVEANIDLSQQRAASVVNYLIANGVDGSRLVPIGHGENQPIASNKNETGRTKNRRVEFRMVVKEELPALVNVKK
jgi:outer membrane protein OmpA-like peptidoglycan-associated protein/plastocyanin